MCAAGLSFHIHLTQRHSLHVSHRLVGISRSSGPTNNRCGAIQLPRHAASQTFAAMTGRSVSIGRRLPDTRRRTPFICRRFGGIYNRCGGITSREPRINQCDGGISRSIDDVIHICDHECRLDHRVGDRFRRTKLSDRRTAPPIRHTAPRYCRSNSREHRMSEIGDHFEHRVHGANDSSGHTNDRERGTNLC